MAIIIRGKTTCGLCGHPLCEKDSLVAFSPFVTNESDPLYQFNDAAFHEKCFHNDPLAKQCLAEYEHIRGKFQDGHRQCDSCQTEIDDPDDYFSTGMLISENDHPLHKYNGLQLHRSCMDEWENLGDFYNLLKEAVHRGEVRGQKIDGIVRQIELAVQKSEQLDLPDLGILEIHNRDKRWPKNAS